VTTTYNLSQTSACGTATGKVVITITNIPAANTGVSKTICNGASANIGLASVAGNTYSWTSIPVGFNSTFANPSVSPTVTTTYNLSQTSACGTATGKVVITITNIPAANTGVSKTICNGASVTIGLASVAGNTSS